MTVYFAFITKYFGSHVTKDFFATNVTSLPRARTSQTTDHESGVKLWLQPGGNLSRSGVPQMMLASTERGKYGANAPAEATEHGKARRRRAGCGHNPIVPDHSRKGNRWLSGRSAS